MYLALDANNGIPLGVQIVAGIRMAIAAQRLLPGDQLPSARDLAAELHVNFHTVRKAYSDLEGEGMLETRRGLGTFVGQAKKAGAAWLRQVVRAHVERLVRDLAGTGVDPDRLLELVQAELARILPPRAAR